eukprot:Skav219384  [mRNA]  locus=scaffold2568:66242:67594:- [translate_table: standard]
MILQDLARDSCGDSIVASPASEVPASKAEETSEVSRPAILEASEQAPAAMVRVAAPIVAEVAKNAVKKIKERMEEPTKFVKPEDEEELLNASSERDVKEVERSLSSQQRPDFFSKPEDSEPTNRGRPSKFVKPDEEEPEEMVEATREILHELRTLEARPSSISLTVAPSLQRHPQELGVKQLK